MVFLSCKHQALIACCSWNARIACKLFLSCKHQAFGYMIFLNCKYAALGCFICCSSVASMAWVFWPWSDGLCCWRMYYWMWHDMQGLHFAGGTVLRCCRIAGSASSADHGKVSSFHCRHAPKRLACCLLYWYAHAQREHRTGLCCVRVALRSGFHWSILCSFGLSTVGVDTHTYMGQHSCH